MRHTTCCVVNCTNTGRNSQCKFYKFPKASWKLKQRERWIIAIRRKNIDGLPWTPKPSDTICGDHFIGGKKSEEEASPSYIPTIFPNIYKRSKTNEETSLSRHTRFLNQRKVKNDNTTSTTSIAGTLQNNNITIDSTVDTLLDRNEAVDRDCQVNFPSDSNETSATLICNRYIGAEKSDAEIQTEIFLRRHLFCCSLPLFS